MFTEREKTSLRSKPGHLSYLDMHQYYEWIELFSFCVFSLRKKKYCTHLFYKIRNKMTGHFLYHIYILQKAKRHWKFSSLKSWSIRLFCEVKIILIILVKFIFSFTLFRDINESNELKLQLFYKQLALEFQIIKQLSRFHHLAVSIDMKYLAI